MRRGDLQEQPIDRDLMVYDPLARQVHVLRGVAGTIFQMCDGKHDVESMEAQIRALYQVSEELDLRRDLLGALVRFREKNLLL